MSARLLEPCAVLDLNDGRSHVRLADASHALCGKRSAWSLTAIEARLKEPCPECEAERVAS